MSSGRRHGKARLLLATALVAWCMGRAASAEPPESPESSARAADAGAQAQAQPPPGDPRVDALRTQAKRIVALLAGTLDPEVDPATLFDVPSSDDAAVAVEAERLRRVLEDPERRSATEAPPADGGKTEDEATPSVDPAVWAARLALDRARLEFYELDADARSALLQRHQDKRIEEGPDESLSDAEREATEAARDRDRALEAARRAHSEARRLVEEERARLLGIKAMLSTFEASLSDTKSALTQESEPVLAWRRRVDETIADRLVGRAGPSLADRLYLELLDDWHAKQAELSAALAAIGDDTGVPKIGDDRLEKLGADVDHRDVDELRRTLVKRREDLDFTVRSLRRERAEVLLEHILALNKDRLDLFPHLSESSRNGFTSVGTDGIAQAVAEIQQVALVLRYHLMATVKWLTDPDARQPGATSTFVAAVTLLKLFALVLPFVWWRRRADKYLASAQRRLAEMRSKSSRPERVDQATAAVSVLRRVRSSLEWLLFFQVAILLLPPRVHDLLEIQLFSTIVIWVLGGTLAVDFVDALAAESPRAKGHTDTAQLRFRSLNLVSRLVVGFGLILDLSDRLVGAGTVHTWVLTFCWFAAIPLVLVLVRWWRPIVIERLVMRRKKNRFTAWAERQHSGLRSFIAVAGGGAFLMGVRLGRTARNYLTAREITRRALAYWFRREVTKQGQRPGGAATRVPLGGAGRGALDPERRVEDFIEGPMDEVSILSEPIDAPGGGVFAVVGERGLGKTTTLRRLHAQSTPSKIVSCPRTGSYEAFRRAIAEEVGLPVDIDDDDLSAHINDARSDSALLIDDAERLVTPVIGGFAEFDRVVSFARRSNATCTWAFAFDSAIWQHLQRARGVRPLFDDVIILDPWTEENIAALLLQRTALADIELRFEGLIRNMPPDADEIDMAEALMKAQQNFYRVIWDYADGNPAVALEFFRNSITEDEHGGKHVDMFLPPAPDALQNLPDSALFVLRAILQLEPENVEAIVDATSLDAGDVADALRHSTFRGYVELSDGCYRVSWKWFRAVTRLLERKHLITALRRSP